MGINSSLPISFALILGVAIPATSLSAPYSSFSKAKKAMYTKVYKNEGKTFYTNCDWSKKKVNLESCGLQDSFPKKYLKRAKRTEAEHIIPASWMYKKNGKWRQCYLDAKQKGVSQRKYCQEHDVDYRNAHNDLVNLVPAVGQLNGMRSNKPFAEKVSGKKEQTFNGDGKKLVLTSRVAIPDSSIRGDIARIAFYMSDRYGVNYSKRQKSLFVRWNLEDPVDSRETSRLLQINKIQQIK